MRIARAMVLLLGVCCGVSSANADGMAARTSHWVGRGCGFQGRLYSEGQFCSLTCQFGVCTMQVCHGGRWVIEPAACRAAFGCPQSC